VRLPFANLAQVFELGLPTINADAHSRTFESQAAHLDRLALLVDGERERIRPQAFNPEVVVDNEVC
jgi:hypothetical protein